MLLIYPAIIHDDKDGLWAEFPDLVGCSTQGDNQQEILAMLCLRYFGSRGKTPSSNLS